MDEDNILSAQAATFSQTLDLRMEIKPLSNTCSVQFSLFIDAARQWGVGGGTLIILLPWPVSDSRAIVGGLDGDIHLVRGSGRKETITCRVNWGLDTQLPALPGPSERKRIWI
ncbi:hypothetical protein PAMP_016603 [Pampus punctatissimus]